MRLSRVTNKTGSDRSQVSSWTSRAHSPRSAVVGKEAFGTSGHRMFDAAAWRPVVGRIKILPSCSAESNTINIIFQNVQCSDAKMRNVSHVV